MKKLYFLTLFSLVVLTSKQIRPEESVYNYIDSIAIGCLTGYYVTKSISINTNVPDGGASESYIKSTILASLIGGITKGHAAKNDGLVQILRKGITAGLISTGVALFSTTFFILASDTSC